MHFCPHVFAAGGHDYQSRYRRWNWIAIFHVLTIKMIKTGIHINTRRESLENPRDHNVDRTIQRQMTTDSRNPLGKWNSVPRCLPTKSKPSTTYDDARILHDPLTSHEVMCSSLTATLETKRPSQRHTPCTCPRESLLTLVHNLTTIVPCVPAHFTTDETDPEVCDLMNWASMIEDVNRWASFARAREEMSTCTRKRIGHLILCRSWRPLHATHATDEVVKRISWHFAFCLTFLIHCMCPFWYWGPRHQAPHTTPLLRRACVDDTSAVWKNSNSDLRWNEVERSATSNCGPKSSVSTSSRLGNLQLMRRTGPCHRFSVLEGPTRLRASRSCSQRNLHVHCACWQKQFVVSLRLLLRLCLQSHIVDTGSSIIHESEADTVYWADALVHFIGGNATNTFAVHTHTFGLNIYKEFSLSTRERINLPVVVYPVQSHTVKLRLLGPHTADMTQPQLQRKAERCHAQLVQPRQKVRDRRSLRLDSGQHGLWIHWRSANLLILPRETQDVSEIQRTEQNMSLLKCDSAFPDGYCGQYSHNRSLQVTTPLRPLLNDKPQTLESSRHFHIHQKPYVINAQQWNAARIASTIMCSAITCAPRCRELKSNELTMFRNNLVETSSPRQNEQDKKKKNKYLACSFSLCSWVQKQNYNQDRKESHSSVPHTKWLSSRWFVQPCKRFWLTSRRKRDRKSQTICVERRLEIVSPRIRGTSAPLWNSRCSKSILQLTLGKRSSYVRQVFPKWYHLGKESSTIIQRKRSYWSTVHRKNSLCTICFAQHGAIWHFVRE